MNTYTIYVGATPIACVADTDDVYTCYEVAKIIGEHADRSVSLVWDETGEEVAYSDPQRNALKMNPMTSMMIAALIPMRVAIPTIVERRNPLIFFCAKLILDKCGNL